MTNRMERVDTMNWLLSKKDEHRLALHQYLITHHSKSFLIKDFDGSNGLVSVLDTTSCATVKR